MERTISVAVLLDAFGHEEHELRKLGAFAQAEGVRISITRMLKLADADLSTNDKQSLEPT
jgi:hypothetical protein